ncbi:LysM peptidoglycan-binding domain-containing protein [Nocardioides sambongensis]|uniref:LysM peptidoglycan-binding domain-containing protein n=1 Tax=Nocardioides sambongensis TaxID=2589074 RepID=UPI001129CFD8|nr:LysM peptidoglycan-binding domain-containing protein [Nocardioides sambongensis]
MSTITLSPVSRTTPARDVRRATSSRRPGVRLTRRGRAVVFALGLMVAFGLGIWLASGSIATSEQGEAPVEVVTVGHGDTLWEIASDAAASTGDGDVRSVMDRIQELNALDSSVVYAGQDLRVPTE